MFNTLAKLLTNGYSSSMDRDQNHKSKVPFGFRDVSFEDKPRLVEGIFNRVASHYDRMNDIMSFGVHRIWKRAMVAKLPKRSGLHHLDVAGGTGDIAFYYLSSLPAHISDTSTTLCDINQEMLKSGLKRAQHEKGKIASSLKWVCGDASLLPIPSQSVDAYTIAFGLRNVTDTLKALQEAYRVLKPGGIFLCLEFSKIVWPLVDQLYDGYAFHVIPFMGKIVARDQAAYQYLVESIARFPNQEVLASMLKEVGFSHVSYQNFARGIAALHQGWRI